MKELSIEEKAKAYDKVREKIAVRFGTDVAEGIFSEFEESEDERIRKALIKYFKNFDSESLYTECLNEENIIAWLEKQGEQKPIWSEEDKRMFDYALDMIEWYSGKNEDKSRLVSGWLKSLKDRVQPQNRWKPSDEQMTDLWNMLCECRPADHQLLQDIYYGLKKLIGE